MTNDIVFPVRIDPADHARLMAASDDESRSAASIIRSALGAHLDRRDALSEIDGGLSANVADAVPHDVMATLRFVVRASQRADAQLIVDRAMALATAGLRDGGADDEIEVMGPTITSSSWAWNADVPPPVTLHFNGIECECTEDQPAVDVHWEWNEITVDGMVGVFSPPRAQCSPWELTLRLPNGVTGKLVLSDRPHADGGERWWLNPAETDPVILGALETVGTWHHPERPAEDAVVGTEAAATRGPLGQLGPCRILDTHNPTVDGGGYVVDPDSFIGMRPPRFGERPDG